MEEHQKHLFFSILENNRLRILRICSAYSFTIEDQKDLYQEVSLQIWKSLSSFRGDSTIETWLYRICLNVCMQSAMKIKKSRPFRNNIKGINLSDEGENIQKKIEQAEKAKQLYKCISQLPAAEKSIVLLFLEDLPYKSIADIIGISENHVAVKIGRIKKKLFNCVNE